jgi:hypothetical protein
MVAVRPLPAHGSIFLDSRGGDRALRVSCHLDDRAAGQGDSDGDGVVVLSLWRDNVCTATFRLGVDDVPEMIETLRAGLDAAYEVVLRRRDQAV